MYKKAAWSEIHMYMDLLSSCNLYFFFAAIVYLCVCKIAFCLFYPDFEQMQCIRAFVAQQPDELSLEKADIILVHQESTDSKIIPPLFPSECLLL